MNNISTGSAQADWPTDLRGTQQFTAYQLTSASLAYLNSPTKRCLDIIGAITGIIIGLPIFGVALLIVWWVDRVPVIFTQERVGLEGQGFLFYKLRTLQTIGHRDQVDSHRIQFKPTYQTTRTGQFWRSTSIDEIIQFWLVLKGDMSLIGHRPFPMYYLPYLADIQGLNAARLNHYIDIIGRFKPGMSSLSSVSGRGNLTMQQKMEYDLIYAQTATLWGDLQLLLRTLAVIITQEGAK